MRFDPSRLVDLRGTLLLASMAEQLFGRYVGAERLWQQAYIKLCKDWGMHTHIYVLIRLCRTDRGTIIACRRDFDARAYEEKRPAWTAGKAGLPTLVAEQVQILSPAPWFAGSGPERSTVPLGCHGGWNLAPIFFGGGLRPP